MRLLERLPRENNRDYTLRLLKENIISLDLVPGCQISEAELAAQLGLSRTPVREAMIELSKVGIVMITPQRPSVVAPIDKKLVEEALFLRKVLECSVVELVCGMAAPQDIACLEESIQLQSFYLRRNSPDQLLLADNQFHEMLFHIAQKDHIHALTQNFSIHFDRVRRMSLDSIVNLKIIEDHTSILTAIRENQASLARELMQTHLSRYQVDIAAIREKYPQFF